MCLVVRLLQAAWLQHQGGAETAVLAARMYAGKHKDHHWIIKLDFNNTINSLWRDKMLLTVQELAPLCATLWHDSIHTSAPLASSMMMSSDPLSVASSTSI